MEPQLAEFVLKEEMTCQCPKMSDGAYDMDVDQNYFEEEVRLASFANFPSSYPVSAPALARAGFYYTGDGDRVKCFSCLAMVEGWQHGDTAIGKHRKISPNCKFINGFNNLRSDCILTQVPVMQNGFQNSAEDLAERSSSEIMADYLLRTGRVVDMSTPKYPRHMEMCSEEARLQTFQNWPAYSPLTPKELANAGLFYTGINDQVKCFCCGGKLMNWEPSDKAWTEHKKHFPECYFVLGRDVGNVATEANTHGGRRRGSELACPAMNDYNARLETFSSWSFPIDKETLAKAGFYSIGDGDATKCFHCGGVLNCWSATDDPWEEHAKAYPGCKFLIDEKGQHFINHAQLKRPILHKANSADASPALPKDSNLLKSPLVTDAQQMGFPLEEIKKVMGQKLKTTGKNYTCVEEFVSDLCAQKETVLEKPKEIEISLEEKLRQLEEEKICKVCMDRRISIVFIPCGHLVACAVCADVLDKCPICCTIVERRQKIFMS
ncbi:E3 ubiquitin-protein ligase XIAP [Xenopus tropicalis]|uniref:E3 ubiquitin-protein ligase XIAP n=1 Tax=Xenopus tropicalis TaxID=8364 RepID=XIAP_XENTR|eukprot:NP_001025583.1 E3 ubiquitin-protein ligase XIAP [Xenopus tropicalis]